MPTFAAPQFFCRPYTSYTTHWNNQVFFQHKTFTVALITSDFIQQNSFNVTLTTFDFMRRTCYMTEQPTNETQLTQVISS